MRGIVHRDVSPHNVLLSWEGAVKVSDFGIAKARSASEATASQFIKGKPAYMSPEQANGQPLDGRSDLFAVGVMLWEMLVGRRLFTGEDTRALLAAVLFGQVPRPRSLRGDVPKDLERIVMKMLERDLPARYATAELAIADLLACDDASKEGREALIAALAERFPDQARVRQSLARVRGASGAERPATPAYGTAAAPWASNPAGTGPAVSMPSLGALHSAETRISRRARMRTLAILVGALVASTGIAFGIVTLARKKSTPSSGSTVVTANGPEAGPAIADTPQTPVQIDAAPPPEPDAPVAPPPVDAGPSPDAQKDVPTARPQESKRYGTLSVTAWPTLTVYVDSKRLGDTPNSFKVAVGKHQLRLRNSETGYDEKLSVTITENHTTKIDRTK
jgi:serine/threonine-protein kinase